MGTTQYPGNLDSFSVPAEPESTSLSSAGSGTRDHPEWHDDAGTAIMALQANAAVKEHDHSGDGSDRKKGAKLTQANTHQSPDTDVAANSLHHTLGTGATQAAAGNHAHDYNGGTIFNKPFFLCQSNNRPVNPALGTMIYEQDTNRVYAWAQFAGNVLAAGLNSTDNFERTNANDLGSNWQITYIDMGNGAGKLATPDGHNASWTDTGNGNYRAIARRVNPLDAVTQTTDQVLTWTTGPTPVEGTLPWTQGAFNDFYVRMSADLQSYVRLSFGNQAIYATYATAGYASEKPLGQINVATAVPNIPFSVRAIGRSFAIYQFGSLLGTIKDNTLVTLMTSNNKGWGMGMQSGARGFGQTTPGNIAEINIADAVVYQSAPRWTLLPVGSVPTCRLVQTVQQKVLNTGTVIAWGTDTSGVIEDSFGQFNPVDPTKVTVNEPGTYDISAAVQWDSSTVPDVAFVVVCLNGIETRLRQSNVMKGGQGSTPGFSQTIAVNGQLRCNPGDTITLKAYYTAAAGLLNLIFTWFGFDGPSKAQSRIDIRYAGV